jgi:flagellar biosynthesis protein FlhF
MMQEANVKRYRAATMRAALEKVKQEMGEDALVLESKRVRAGGFLGLGAQEVVELRVIPNPASEVQAKQRKSAERSSFNLSLTDDAPAAPTHDAPVTEALKTGKAAKGAAGKRAAKSEVVRASEAEAAPPQPMLGALAARAYHNAARDQAEGAGDSELHAAAQAAPEARRGVEVAETAPRVVHARPAAAQATQTAAVPEAKPEAKSAPRDAAGLDFARQEMARMRSELRSELRAISYSINSFAALSREFDSHETRSVIESDPELFEFPYYESYLLLVSTGLTPDAARKAVRAAMKNGLREVRDVNTVARAGLVGTLQNLVRFGEDPLAAAPGEATAPAALVLVGPTGVGKTTTVAKLAARVVCRLRRRCELITLDTYRVAAVEQLKTYAEIMGVGCHVAHNVHELDALARRYAGEATVLIDTAGRSPHDLAEEMELGDYLRERADLMKLLVLPATTQAEDVRAALRQFAIYGANRLALTKLDETTRPGAAITAVAASHLPLVYLCAGQRVPEDFERATPLTLASHVVRAGAAAAAV